MCERNPISSAVDSIASPLVCVVAIFIRLVEESKQLAEIVGDKTDTATNNDADAQ